MSASPDQPTTAVEFFFDYSCPWTYLAFTRLQESAARTGAAIAFRPVSLPLVHEKTNPGLAKSRSDPNPARARYAVQDLADWADYCGVTLRRGPEPVADSLPALRGAICAIASGHARPYSRAVFAGQFAVGDNIADAAVLSGYAAAAGIAPADFERALDDPATLDKVRANSAELVERGGFGSPSMFVGGRLYFGNDRMPLVEFALGQTSGRRFVMPGDHRDLTGDD